jgi:hypothetical protein
MEAKTRAVAFAVSVWPESVTCMDAALWSVTVRDESYGNWSVRRGAVSGDRPPSGHDAPALGRDGRWHHEGIPSERTREEIERDRFTLEEALKLAGDMAPRVEVNGMTAVDAFIRHEMRRGALGDCPGCAGPYTARP